MCYSMYVATKLDGEARGVIVLTGVCQMGSAGCRPMRVASLIIQHLRFKHLSATRGEIGSR